MGDDGPLVATDDELVDPLPDPPSATGDPEAPEHDAIEQSVEVAPGWRQGAPSTAFDAPEADAIDQALDVPPDDSTFDRG